jgi:hypothetical protein
MPAPISKPEALKNIVVYLRILVILTIHNCRQGRERKALQRKWLDAIMFFWGLRRLRWVTAVPSPKAALSLQSRLFALLDAEADSLDLRLIPLTESQRLSARKAAKPQIGSRTFRAKPTYIRTLCFFGVDCCAREALEAQLSLIFVAPTEQTSSAGA